MLKNNREKEIMCNTPVDLKKERIFSYVLCTQWLQLYTYILSCFDIDVIKRNIPGQDHVWGEIKLNDNLIVIVDATEYIDSSIDLSNAKSVSPTVGFVVLPKEYTGIKLYDVFNKPENKELSKKIKIYYEYNRELDMSLGYINKSGYKVEKIIRENDLFNYPYPVIKNCDDLKRYTNMTIEFFKNLRIPKNIDGYEIFAYYSKFIRKLPINIAANISQKTIYVDSFSYKQGNLRRKFLHAPLEYLMYLEDLVYSRYYNYLTEEENNIVLEKIKNGYLSGKQILEQIVECEMKIAEIDRSLNFYYAINKLQFYDPSTYDTLRIQVYEPMMGSKSFNSDEEFTRFKEKKHI